MKRLNEFLNEVEDKDIYLKKNGFVQVFANRTQAEAAAKKVGGFAIQSNQSRRFLVRLPDSTKEPIKEDNKKDSVTLKIHDPERQGKTLSLYQTGGQIEWEVVHDASVAGKRFPVGNVSIGFDFRKLVDKVKRSDWVTRIPFYTGHELIKWITQNLSAEITELNTPEV